jgi:hypothetical protein
VEDRASTINYEQAILYMHPNARPLDDFVIADNEGRQYIESWNLDDPLPSQDQLRAAWLEVQCNHKRDEIAAAGRSSLAGSGARNLDEAQIAATGKIDELVRYTLSEGDRARIEAELDGLQAVRGRWNTILARIDEAATHADLDAIQWEMEL